MQITEVTDYAVRSAVLRLTRRETPMQFLIFPMVHIGDPSFYAAVTSRLRDTDLIVAEGIGGPAEPPVVDPTLHWPGLDLEDLPPVRPRWSVFSALSTLTAGHQPASLAEQLGLAEQNIDYDALGPPVLSPDMNDKEFATAWRELPAWHRALAALGPLISLNRTAVSSRRSLAASLEIDDRTATAPPPGSEKLFELIFDKRDRLLMTALEAIHEVHAGDPLTVAVVYGAFHVPKIVHGLREHYGYSVRDAEWLTVFTLDDLGQPRPR